jgi:ferritin
LAIPDEQEETNVINGDITERLNAQLNRELFSAYFYLGLSASAESAGLKGAAAWFHAKYQEETAHALKFYRYLLDQGAEVVLSAIAEPPAGQSDLVSMFEETLAHEREVTAAINDIVDASLSAKDHATHIFLQWFVTEQIEEEATVSEILARLRLVGSRGEGLYMLDRELSDLAGQMTQQSAIPAG